MNKPKRPDIWLHLGAETTDTQRAEHYSMMCDHFIDVEKWADARIAQLEETVRDGGALLVKYRQEITSLESQMRGQTFQTPDEKDARIEKLEAALLDIRNGSLPKGHTAGSWAGAALAASETNCVNQPKGE